MGAALFCSSKPGEGRKEKDSAKLSTGGDEKGRDRSRLHSSVYYALIWIRKRGGKARKIITSTGVNSYCSS